MARPTRLQRLQRRLRRIRANLRWVRLVGWFYNLDNYRDDAQVKRELEAIASTRPDFIALVEAIGNRLPNLPGYHLDEDSGGHPRSNQRVNIATYVHKDLPLRGGRWIDLDGTWPRTQGPGIHPARSFRALFLGLQLVIAHQAPKNARGAVELQLEGIDALTDVMAPWTRASWRRRGRVSRAIARLRPRLLVWDSNRISGQWPGPDLLAKRIRGRVHGGARIDNAVTRGSIGVHSISKHGHVAGVKLRSDHKGAIRIDLRIRAGWLPRL